MTSIEFAKEAGITLRQLQWWTEHGVIEPSGIPTHPRRRCWSESDVPQARKVATLSQIGIKLEAIKQLLTAQFREVVAISAPTVFGSSLVVPLRNDSIVLTGRKYNRPVKTKQRIAQDLTRCGWTIPSGKHHKHLKYS